VLSAGQPLESAAGGSQAGQFADRGRRYDGLKIAKTSTQLFSMSARQAAKHREELRSQNAPHLTAPRRPASGRNNAQGPKRPGEPRAVKRKGTKSRKFSTISWPLVTGLLLFHATSATGWAEPSCWHRPCSLPAARVVEGTRKRMWTFRLRESWAVRLSPTGRGAKLCRSQYSGRCAISFW